VAYLFRANRMPSGAKALPSDSVTLKRIIIAIDDTLRRD
jgi:hypothetical protein